MTASGNGSLNVNLSSVHSLRIAVLITLAGSCGLACAQATPFGQSDDAKPARTASNVAKPAPDTAVNRRKSRLVRMLTGRSERVRYNAVLRLRHDRAQSVASLDELLTALEIQAETLIDSDLPPSLVELVYLVASIDQPKVEEALIKLLDSENADLAMIVADALGRNQFFNAIDDLARQVGCEAYQERYAFRFNLVRSLIQMKHPDAVGAKVAKRTRLISTVNWGTNSTSCLLTSRWTISVATRSDIRLGSRTARKEQTSRRSVSVTPPAARLTSKSDLRSRTTTGSTSKRDG